MISGRDRIFFQASSLLRPSKMTGPLSLEMTTGVWGRAAMLGSWDRPGQMMARTIAAAAVR
jgi:hypothetical protein